MSGVNSRAMWCGAIAALLMPWASLAQSPPEPGSTLPADKLLIKAAADYTSGKWAEAAAGYQSFINDYGASLEAREAMASLRYPLAMCYIQEQKYEEAGKAVATALGFQPALPPREKQELMFWKGVCLMQADDLPAARKSLEEFVALFAPGADRIPAQVSSFPAVQKVPEAQLLIGTAYLMEEKFKEAADYFAALKPQLFHAENRGRATVLELFALVQAGQDERAMELVRKEFPNIGDMTQVVTFQTLTLELGSQFLEKREYRKAIICLQRIWTSERLLKHQQERLGSLESQLQALRDNPRADAYQKFLCGQMISKVKRELENFRKIPNFNSALRLRLASAYQGLSRYREAALIMEDMLATMPPDPVVESASVSLVQCWSQTERWPKVIEDAKGFAAKFPRSKQLPLVLYLEGMAQQKDMAYADAIATFNLIVDTQKDSEFAPRALFMRGFTQLLAEKNKEAAATFEDFLKRYPQNELADPAAYWMAMAYSFDKQYARCRELMDGYLKAYPGGAYRGNAVFRKAYAIHSLKQYDRSVVELRDYLRQYPGHEENSEALVLLGDALMAQGDIDGGIAAFKRIPPTDSRFFEEGWFKSGKALRLSERTDELRAHMVQFQKEHPRSMRVAEALYWIGWTYRQQDRIDEARRVYWDALAELGDDPTMQSVEDLFPALTRLYKGPEEQAQLAAKLRDLREEAAVAGKKTLAMRVLWAQANLFKKSDPTKARDLLLESAALSNVQTTNPMLLADFAEAFTLSGKAAEGEKMYRDLVKWNPRAAQKDRALAALGTIELERGNEKAALDLFDRFERETGGSVLFAQVMLKRAELLQKRGQPAEAKKALEALLASKTATGKEKAEALYRIGEQHMKEGKPELAMPYYQRIYIMHARWAPWVAKAYLRSGEAFEKLKDTDAARKTYSEMVAKEELGTFEETATARRRLEELGGPVKL